ncbi:MAG TPA: DHH family phosphoesterase [Acidobacteriota bacterium]|nr:DHH family phosphoesterase [Acidobacteriota bacterium]
MELKERFLSLISGKKVHIATHWDCDGVTSGGLLYHIVKPHAASVTTISKGDVFLILPQDVPADADIIICSDIQPSQELDPNKVIYIDHHPHEFSDNYLLSIHDVKSQSCTMVIWEKLISDTNNPYFIFLTLLGYFGDSGNPNLIPAELQVRAKAHFPHLLEPRMSQFSDKTYVGLELFVSLFNTGKRMHWSGHVPLELLKAVSNYQDITLNRHPLVDELNRYKLELRRLYDQKVEFKETQQFDYAVIQCDKNIQGVLCSRYMQDKPIVVLNQYKGKVIASMRVPEHVEFDAGAFLSSFKKFSPDILGGGHEKAGGITFDGTNLQTFLKFLNEHGAS